MSKSHRPGEHQLEHEGHEHSHGHGHGHGEQVQYGNGFMAEQMENEGLFGRRTATLDSKQAAIENYRQNAVFMAQFMNRFRDRAGRNAADPNDKTNIIRNSVEWIDEGNATLRILTPTHDSAHRAAAAGENGKIAHFDTRVDYRHMGDYDDRVNAQGYPTQNAGIKFHRQGVGGSMSLDGRDLTIVSPKDKSEATLIESFIHEVQHDADQHRQGENWATSEGPANPRDAYTAPTWVYNSFQTEFRAYWMNTSDRRGDRFGHSANTRVNNRSFHARYANAAGQVVREATATTQFTNERQQKIFDHMVQNFRQDGIYRQGQTWTQSYAYLPHYYAFDPRFKAMVDRTALPHAGNLVNSVRIQDLSDAIAARSANRVQAAVDALDSLDINYLRDTTQSAALWQQARSRLGQGNSYRYLVNRINNG